MLEVHNPRSTRRGGCCCGLHDQQDRDQPQGPPQPGVPLLCHVSSDPRPRGRIHGPTTCPGARRYGLAGRSCSRESPDLPRSASDVGPGRRRPYQVTPKEASHTRKYVAVAKIIMEYGSTDVPRAVPSRLHHLAARWPNPWANVMPPPPAPPRWPRSAGERIPEHLTRVGRWARDGPVTG